MNPILYLSLVGVAILVSGIPFYSGTNALLFSWLWFNLFIAIYEFYIVANKDRFNPSQCPVDFWREPVQEDFWLKAWHEYSCFSDRRYLTPSDFVFWIEFGNAVLVVLLWLAYLLNQWVLVSILLILQAYHCSIYFISLVHSKNYTEKEPWKLRFYLTISSLWIIVPIWILLQSV